MVIAWQKRTELGKGGEAVCWRHTVGRGFLLFSLSLLFRLSLFPFSVLRTLLFVWPPHIQIPWVVVSMATMLLKAAQNIRVTDVVPLWLIKRYRGLPISPWPRQQVNKGNWQPLRTNRGIPEPAGQLTCFSPMPSYLYTTCYSHLSRHRINPKTLWRKRYFLQSTQDCGGPKCLYSDVHNG